MDYFERRHFILLKDLETEFTHCCQLDVKLGTRTYCTNKDY